MNKTSKIIKTLLFTTAYLLFDIQLITSDSMAQELSEAQIMQNSCNDDDIYSDCVFYEALTFSSKVGSDASKKKAFYNFKMLCEQGNLKRCYDLSFLYLHGQGVEENDQEAIRLVRSSCNSGFMLACYELGQYMEYGVIDNYSENELEQVYERSCQENITKACSALALNLTRQLETKGNAISQQELDRALFYTHRACELGDASDCFYLGFVYRKGYKELLAINSEKAISYFDLACKYGDQSACLEQADMLKVGAEVDEN